MSMPRVPGVACAQGRLCAESVGLKPPLVSTVVS